MSSRARIFAAVTLLGGGLAGNAAWAQATNLEAGKSASQLFAGTCTACHKGPRGLLKTVSPGSLPGFLREHYTTSSDMASQLASFLISNGANDNRQAKQGADAKQGGGSDQSGDRQGRRQRNAPTQEAVRPDAESPAVQDGRQGHRRVARPGEAIEETKPSPDGGPAQAVIDRGPDGRKQRLGKRGKPGAEEAPAVEPPRAEPSMSDQAKGETGKTENATVERTRPDDETRSNEPRTGEAKPGEVKSSDANPNDRPDATRTEPAKDTSSGEKAAGRRDPMPPVTPAAPAAAMTPPATLSGSSEASAPKPAAPETPAVAASAPPPAGPPAPPISQ